MGSSGALRPIAIEWTKIQNRLRKRQESRLKSKKEVHHGNVFPLYLKGSGGIQDRNGCQDNVNLLEEESAEAHSPPDMLSRICYIQQVHFSHILLSSVLIFVVANAVSLVTF